MKTKLKIVGVLVVALVIIVGGIAVYRGLSTPEDSTPWETTLADAAEMTTQKLTISDVFETTKGNIPLITKNKFLVQYKTTVTAGFDVDKADVKEKADEIVVTIPHCTINEDSIKIKSSDLMIYDTNFALLSADEDAVLEIVAEAEEHAKETANSEEYGLLTNADENAKRVMQGMFENNADGKTVVVKFSND